MAWYPEAVRKQLTVPRRAAPNEPLSMPSPVRINLHTAVSNSTSLAWSGTPGTSTYRANYFNTTGAGGVFSHFYLREDGVVEQMQDTKYRSSCDLDGNPDTISIESWDGYKTGFPGYWSSDSDVPPWNAEQVAGLTKLLRWLYATHPSIPRVLATSNRKGYESRGLSYHRLGVPGYALYSAAEGGLMYTTSYKKGCPGNRRISQIPDIHRAAIDGTNPPEEDDMPLTDSDISRIAAAVNPWRATFGSEDDTAGSRLSRILLAAEAAASNTRPITRGGEERPVRQELADVLTLTLAQAGELAGLKAALSTIAGGGLDLAAVEAAAKRGVEAGLAGASVVIDFPKEEQA